MTKKLLKQIESAASVINHVPPIGTFIATNPLSVFETLPFEKAISEGSRLFGGKVLPNKKLRIQALAQKKIDISVLEEVLAKYGYAYDDMFIADSSYEKKFISNVDLLIIKYLAAFLDEGRAGWPMPYREKGFYACWKKLAVYDTDIPERDLVSKLPEKAIDALQFLLEGTENTEELLKAHLLELPGWSGFIKWRAKQSHYYYCWQKVHPITMADYLAVRLFIAKQLDEFTPKATNQADIKGQDLCWLEAWEETYRRRLLKKLSSSYSSKKPTDNPDAQLIFCMDVRSEVLRRHLEGLGNYETLSLPGSFNLPTESENFSNETTDEHGNTISKRKLSLSKSLNSIRRIGHKLENDIIGRFILVNIAGLLFGLSIIAKTFTPLWFAQLRRKLWSKLSSRMHEEERPVITLPPEEQLIRAEGLLKTIGLTKGFARIVLLCGHGSESVNNPNAAIYNCGACKGSHGGYNAKLMARILNAQEIRDGLREKGIDIPKSTIFISGQHNTTTDEVELYLEEKASINTKVKTLISDLEKGSKAARDERALAFKRGKSLHIRATDWAEVRPEWGLARNAAFIVGCRAMTKGIDLEGRAFLHSYDWEADETGQVLESILSGPMLIAKDINMQYYFATTDNEVFGSGSKTTQNVVGNFGIMQGSISDLKNGLPKQSVIDSNDEIYHEPLRLSTIVQAPLTTAEKIIDSNEKLKNIFANGWVSLIIIDPISKHFYRYERDGNWSKPCL